MVGLDWNGWDKGVEGIVYSMLFVLSDLRQIKRDKQNNFGLKFGQNQISISWDIPLY